MDRMAGLGVTLLLVVTFLVFTSGYDVLEQNRSVARCRAHCLDTLAKDVMSRETCVSAGNPECHMCWEVCQSFVRDPFPWILACQGSRRYICNTGCRTACNSILDQPPIRQPFIGPISFSVNPDVQITDGERLVVTWEPFRPEVKTSDHKQSRTAAVVYLLYWKSASNADWKLVTMTTAAAHALHRHYSDFSGLEFRLEILSGDRMWATEFLGYPDDTSYAGERPPAVQDLRLDTIFLQTKYGDQFQITSTWTSPISGTEHAEDDLEVTWNFVACRRSSVCSSSAQRFAMIPVPPGLRRLTLPGLMYNAEYWIEIRQEGSRPSRRYFSTPHCRTTDVTGTLCLDRSQDPKRSLGPQISLAVTLSACALLSASVIVTLVIYCLRYCRLSSKTLTVAYVLSKAASLCGKRHRRREIFRAIPSSVYFSTPPSDEDLNRHEKLFVHRRSPRDPSTEKTVWHSPLWSGTDNDPCSRPDTSVV